jgi:predicted transcriptional regulator
VNNRFTLWLEDDERNRLDELARELGLSRNQIARAGLRALLGLPVSDRLLEAVWAAKVTE